MIPINVSCAVIIDGNKVLMTQRSEQMNHALQWEFPGGKCEEGESHKDCLHREIKEELGVSIKLIDALPPVIQQYPDKHIRLFPFICKLLDEEIQLYEHKKYTWFRFDALRSIDILPADLKIFSHLLSGGYLFY